MPFRRGSVELSQHSSSPYSSSPSATGLREQGLPPAVCLAVHAVFSEETFGKLKEAAATVVTTNSIPHSSNGIDVVPVIARSVGDLL